VRLDDENQEIVYSKDVESIETTLAKQESVKGSTFVKVMAFCTNKDMKAQYIKSVDVFLKPKPASEVTEHTELIVVDADQDLNSIIDPVGLLIFGEDMNDEQRVGLFADMTEKLFVKSQMESNAFELATISKKIIDLIPSAHFESKETEELVYIQMANMVERQLAEMGVSKDKIVDAQSISQESLSLLAECVETLVQHLPRSQTALINAFKLGLLRDIAQIDGTEQSFSVPTFSAKQIRRVDTRGDDILAQLEVTSDSNTAAVIVPEA